LERNALEVYEQVKSLFMEQLQVEMELIQPSLSFGDIPEWDSIGHMTLIAALEEQFGIEVTTDTISQMVSIEAICDLVQKAQHNE